MAKFTVETTFDSSENLIFACLDAQGNHVGVVKTKNEKIMARSYEKFFRIGETRETELIALKSRLKFPVNAYVKENGFLEYANVHGNFYGTPKVNVEKMLDEK